MRAPTAGPFAVLVESVAAVVPVPAGLAMTAPQVTAASVAHSSRADSVQAVLDRGLQCLICLLCLALVLLVWMVSLVLLVW